MKTPLKKPNMEWTEEDEKELQIMGQELVDNLNKNIEESD